MGDSIFAVSRSPPQLREMPGPRAALSLQQVAGAHENSPRCPRASGSSAGSGGSGAAGCRRPSVTSISSQSTTDSWLLRGKQYHPLGDLGCSAPWNDMPDIGNVLVRVKGCDEEPFRVPLQVEFKTGGDGVAMLVDAASQLPFQEYVACEIGEDVTALYYRIRVTERSAGEGTTELVKFSGRRNPFVRGMEIIACVNGDTPPEDERPAAMGCSIM